LSVLLDTIWWVIRLTEASNDARLALIHQLHHGGSVDKSTIPGRLEYLTKEVARLRNFRTTLIRYLGSKPDYSVVPNEVKDIFTYLDRCYMNQNTYLEVRKVIDLVSQRFADSDLALLSEREVNHLLAKLKSFGKE
jgi:hypothetical protein